MCIVFFFTCLYRLVCKIQEKSTANQNLTITLQVNEGEVEGRYSIEGTAQASGFSFVVRTTFFFLKQKLCICLPSSQGCIVTSCVGRSLSVQEPSITDISPDYGPMFGGTTVTLTGTHLNSGVRRDVFIAEKKCLVQRSAVSQGSASLLVGCNPKVGFMALWAVSQPFLFFKKGS